MTEYRKVKTQIRHAVDFDQAELVIKSTFVRKLAFQTFDKICDLYVTHDFTLKQMGTGIQHIIDKLEQATLVMGEKANVKRVGVSSQQTNQQPNQQNRKSNQEFSYCSSSRFTNECTKYKAVNARKDRVMALKLCFNCLKPGHSSKTVVVTEHVVPVAYIIIHHFALRLVEAILVITKVRIRVQTATQIQKLSVKEN